MNDLTESLIEIRNKLRTLDDQIEGAAYMVNENSPHREFLKYIQRCLRGTHDSISFQLKINITSQNCS
jgi:hypothetical protein